MNEDDEVLTYYDIIVRQQQIIKDIFSVVESHEKMIRYLRYDVIFMFTLVLIMLFIFIVIVINL